MTTVVDTGVESVAEMSKPNFLSIPNELQLSVLSHLPAKDIQRARRVCKHICALIDEPSNAITLYARAEYREYERLRADISYFLDYSNITFVEALQRFCERRGIWHNPDDQKQLLSVFIVLWTSQHQHVHPSIVLPLLSPPLQQKFMFIIAADLLNVHRQGLLQQPTLVINGAPPMHLFYAHESGAPINAWRNDIAQKALFHKAPLAPAPQLAVPRWPLTSLYYINQEPPTRGGLDFFAGICHQTSLAELLGVPELPTYCNGSFSYCVRSPKTYGLFVGGMHQGEMSLADRVRVMEDMFLF